MNLLMASELGTNYKGPTQKVRVITESWMGNEGYCPSCLGKLTPYRANFKAADFACSKCIASFQLKSTKSRIGATVPDGAFDTMLAAIRSDTSPSLILLRYSLDTWTVRDLIVIPSFALSEQAIVPRKPLAIHARRAGWVGCNIDLGRIAPDARVQVVNNGEIIPPSEVGARYARLRPLSAIAPKQRGWTLAVFSAIQTKMHNYFSTQDAYTLENDLSAIFPRNRNVRPKIRQQLQVLRDLGLLKHLDRGTWELTKTTPHM